MWKPTTDERKRTGCSVARAARGHEGERAHSGTEAGAFVRDHVYLSAQRGYSHALALMRMSAGHASSGQSRIGLACHLAYPHPPFQDS